MALNTTYATVLWGFNVNELYLNIKICDLLNVFCSELRGLSTQMQRIYHCIYGKPWSDRFPTDPGLSWKLACRFLHLCRGRQEAGTIIVRNKLNIHINRMGCAVKNWQRTAEFHMPYNNVDFRANLMNGNQSGTTLKVNNYSHPPAAWVGKMAECMKHFQGSRRQWSHREKPSMRQSLCNNWRPMRMIGVDVGWSQDFKACKIHMVIQEEQRGLNQTYCKARQLHA